MSEHNGSERTIPTPPETHTGGVSESHVERPRLAQVPELGEFNSELNTACLAVVEDYRSAKLSMAEASLAVVEELSKHTTVPVERRNTAFKVFFEQLREHERLTALSSQRGREVESGPAPPVEDGSDSEDGEESPKSHVQPLLRKRAADDDGDHADAVKRRIDESIIPFAQSGNLAGLSVELQSTLKFKENYTRNLESVKQLAISNPEVPEFPQALWKDVLANNFVDLDKVLSGEYSTSGDPKVVEKFGDTGYSLTAGDIKASKHIRSHGEWTIAWNTYSDAVEFAYPHRHRELRIYSAEVTRLFGATLLESADRVIQFDRAAWSRAARSNRILLSDLGNFNDLCISHFSSAGAGTSISPAKPQASGSRGTSEICRRFNDGTCVSRSCKFRHACFTCKVRDHGSHSCGKASSSSTQPKFDRK